MSDAAEIRSEFIEAAKNAAWQETVKCPTCGDGRVPGDRMLIHSRSPHGFGADWTLESVLDAIERSPSVRWTKSIFRHDLLVEIDYKVYAFEVRRPEDSGEDRGGAK